MLTSHKGFEMQEYRQQTGTPVSDQQLDDLTTATSLTVPEGVREVSIQAQGGNVRFGINSTPTSLIGGKIFDGNWHTFNGNLDRISLIEEDSGAQAYATYAEGT